MAICTEQDTFIKLSLQFLPTDISCDEIRNFLFTSSFFLVMEVIDSKKFCLIPAISTFTTQVLNCFSFTLVTFLHPTSKAVVALCFIGPGRFAALYT